MTKPAQPPKATPHATTPRPVPQHWIAELVLGLLALFLVSFVATLALDTGSLLAYATAIVFVALTIRHFYKAVQGFVAFRKKRLREHE